MNRNLTELADAIYQTVKGTQFTPQLSEIEWFKIAQACRDAAPSTQPEVRLNPDGTLDEVVAHGCSFHLEQMDFNHWWLEVYQPQGVGISVWLQAKTKIRASTEKRTYGLDRDARSPQPSDS